MVRKNALCLWLDGAALEAAQFQEDRRGNDRSGVVEK